MNDIQKLKAKDWRFDLHTRLASGQVFVHSFRGFGMLETMISRLRKTKIRGERKADVEPAVPEHLLSLQSTYVKKTNNLLRKDYRRLDHLFFHRDLQM
ncbi:hypothetical protein LXL04_035073 [Taraxacum kok-saghyz]